MAHFGLTQWTKLVGRVSKLLIERESGGQGQNRTADTGIFRPYVTINKPIKNNNLSFLWRKVWCKKGTKKRVIESGLRDTIVLSLQSLRNGFE